MITKRILPLAAAAALALTMTACSSGPTTAEPDRLMTATEGACEGTEGVTLLIDATALGEDKRESCVIADEMIEAVGVLQLASVSVEGTTEYPDDIVCRVDGLPAEDTALESDEGEVVHEACDSMPPMFAYWSMWVQPAGAEWEYAQEGVSTLTLEPGESLALVFTLNGEPETP